MGNKVQLSLNLRSQTPITFPRICADIKEVHTFAFTTMGTRKKLELKCVDCYRGRRLRVVPHFSSGIVERSKREPAWKSSHARTGDTRRGERKISLSPPRVAFSRVIFTRARVSLSLLSLRKNGGLLVVYRGRASQLLPIACVPSNNPKVELVLIPLVSKVVNYYCLFCFIIILPYKLNIYT